MIKNVLRKPVLSGLLESDIVKVRDMSEKATENKVYYKLFVGDKTIINIIEIFTSINQNLHVTSAFDQSLSVSKSIISFNVTCAA